MSGASYASSVRVGIRRGMPLLVTVAVFALILRRIPFERLVGALREADYVVFLAYMIPNAIVYFCWDTFVLATAIR